MARLSALFVAFGLLSTSIAVAHPPKYDQEEQHRDATCSNKCYSDSFPPGSCTDDPACLCNLKKYRERYLCCMGEKCDSSVLPDGMTRHGLACEGRGLPYEFDPEAVCGITLTTSGPPESTVTSTATATDSSKPSEASASTSAVSDTPTGTSDSTETQTGTGEAAATTTDNSAPVERATLNRLAILGAISGVLFW